MPYLIKSLSNGLKVYRTIVDHSKPIQAKILCQKLNMNKSTMSRLLKTLKNEGFISYLENSDDIIANDLGLKTNRSTKIELLINRTKTLLEDISLNTKECSYLGIFDDYRVLYINQIDLSSRKIKTRNSIGVQAQLHTSALGKSILAFGNYELNKLKLNHYTKNTIINIQNLKNELEQVKQRGFSLDNKEYQDDMRCVATPLFNKQNILIGSIGISGSANRLTMKKMLEFGEYLSSLARLNNIMF